MLILARPVTDAVPFFDLNFTGLTPGVYTSHAGLDLTFTRSSSGAMCQTSASTVSASASTNQGLIKSRGVTGVVGHLVRRAFTNVHIYGRAFNSGSFPPMASGSGASFSSSGTSPRSGVTDALRVEVTSDGYANYFADNTLNGNYTCSLWRRAHSGTSTHQWVIGRGGSNAADVSTASTTWERRVLTALGNGSNYFSMCPATGGWTGAGWTGTTSMAQDVYVDLIQLESGLIAHDPMVTSGASATSTAELLGSGAATNLNASDYLGLWYQFAPEGSSAAYASHGDCYLFDHVHGAGIHSYAKVDGATLAVSMRYAGMGSEVTFANPLPSWSAGDQLDVWIEGKSGDQRGKARINGGKPVSLGTGTVSGVSLADTLVINHLSNGTDSQFEAALMRVRGYGYNRRPSWAA